MSAQSMLEQLLKSGMSLLDGKSAAQGSTAAGQSDPGWGKFGAGAATGGVLGLLLGSQGGRRLGGKALKYGSVAALGVMAYRAYNNWQAQQRPELAQPASPQTGAAISAEPAARTMNLLPAPDAEQHSRALLKAMIAAAKADGHMDERERGLVESALQRVEPDPELRGWFEAELRRPLDPAEVAQAAATPEMAAEVYLASLMVTDDTSFMERAYLDELARQLRLADGLKLELERQSKAASAA
jgi:uncharacterized membrane protein YebE (DUF533 family)